MIQPSASLEDGITADKSYEFFMKPSKFATVTVYECKLCSHKMIFPGEKKTVQKTGRKHKEMVQILETPAKKQKLEQVQICQKKKEIKNLKKMALSNNDDHLKKRKESVKESNTLNVSNFLNSLGIKS